MSCCRGTGLKSAAEINEKKAYVLPDGRRLTGRDPTEYLMKILTEGGCRREGDGRQRELVLHRFRLRHGAQNRPRKDQTRRRPASSQRETSSLLALNVSVAWHSVPAQFHW